MRIVEINGGVFGSTGKIMFSLSDMAEKEGHTVLCCAPITKTNRRKDPGKPYYRIGSYYSRLVSVFMDRLFGGRVTAFFSTKKLIRKLTEFQPDLIHLHVLHGGFINYSLLFKYIKKSKIRVIWTFHDCWAFTGHCPHFVSVKCEKWKIQCSKCPLFRDYPKCYFDNSKQLFKLKKACFTGVENMTIVTPSQWLADLVKQSFLKEYPVQVIYNGIDLSIFKPIESDFREKNGVSKEKYILLGVSFVWSKRKGLDVFIELAKRLPDKYQIVLVGTDDQVDKQLPKNIISIHRTQNQTELAEIYTAADLFVNPTREEALGLVNVESIACGTPVVTFRTGGSPECIDETCGSIVDCDDIDALYKEIIRITSDNLYSKNECLIRAQSFDMNEKNREYLRLYLFLNE